MRCSAGLAWIVRLGWLWCARDVALQAGLDRAMDVDGTLHIDLVCADTHWLLRAADHHVWGDGQSSLGKDQSQNPAARTQGDVAAAQQIAQHPAISAQLQLADRLDIALEQTAGLNFKRSLHHQGTGDAL